MFLSKKEKRAYRIGIITGIKKSNNKIKKRKTSHRVIKRKTNCRVSRNKPVYLGPTFVNGEFYDTNFKKPVKLDSKFVRELHSEYDPDGKSSDKVVVDRYVNHMRRKFGLFDKNDKFLGMLSDE